MRGIAAGLASLPQTGLVGYTTNAMLKRANR